MSYAYEFLPAAKYCNKKCVSYIVHSDWIAQQTNKVQNLGSLHSNEGYQSFQSAYCEPRNYSLKALRQDMEAVGVAAPGSLHVSVAWNGRIVES